MGFALAERMLAARFNREGHEIVDHHTYVIASDGDMEEGIGSEACSLAGHLGLGRLDRLLRQQPHLARRAHERCRSPRTSAARFEAYGWHVQDLGEEIELDRIEAATRAAMEVEDRPSLVILRTHIGFGSPNKQDTARGARQRRSARRRSS